MTGINGVILAARSMRRSQVAFGRTFTLVCLLIAVTIVPKTAVASSRDGPPESDNFGKVLKLLNGKHPQLDLTRKSAFQSFHFTFGLSGQRVPKTTNSSKHRSFIELRVVRDNAAYAAILFFSDGPSFYCTSNGPHSIVAMVDPDAPSKVFLAKSASIYFAAMLTNAEANELKHPPSASTYQFGITMHRMRFPICLKVFGFIRAKLHVAHKVKFLASRFPTLSFWWPNARNAADENMKVSFIEGRGVQFPLRKLVVTMWRGSELVGTAWISHVGPGIERGGPVTHRMMGLRQRADMPWQACSSAEMYGRFRAFLADKHTPLPLTRSFTLLRARFLKWAITPDAVSSWVPRNDLEK